MTRDEIMALTPEKLRIEIAKALGWHFWHDVNEPPKFVYPILGTDLEDGVKYIEWEQCTENDGEIHWQSIDPNWTKKIGDAFELLKDHTYDVSKYVDGVHRVGIYPHRMGTYYFAEADTLPMAISRAWMCMHEGV